MPTLYRLKPGFQRVLRPLAGWLAAAGITANQVTVATGVASVALGSALTWGRRGWILLPVFVVVRMALNAIDGMMARDYGQASRLGAILNEVIDVISDAALALPFATLPGWNPLWVTGAIFFASLTEMAGVAAQAAGTSRRYDGPFGKSDRAFALGFAGGWLAFGWPVSAPVRMWVPAVWITLCLITIAQRIRRGVAHQSTNAAISAAMTDRPPRTCEERSFQTHDGVPIFFRYWPGTGERAVLLLHRGHEHSGRVAHLANELDMPEASFFAWDARAHGRSGGEQGSSTTMATFVQDLDEFVRHIGSEFGVAMENLAVVAQSVGAVIAAAWVHDYAPPIRSLVLASPAFQVKLYVPCARLGLGIWRRLAGDFYVQSYVRGRALTHDRERIETYASDPLIKLRISARVLLDLYKVSERLVADAPAIRVPTAILLSGSDWVIHNRPVLRFFDGLGTGEKEIHTFPGFYHDTLGERDRRLAVAKVRAFLKRQFEQPSLRSSLADADRAGFTTTEYQRLLRPRPLWSPAGFSFTLTRLFLRTLGRLSDGVRLGWRAGFDSGSSLDYVYRNRPGGISPIGRLIDWFYLNSPGWTGIRARKGMIEELIGRALAATRESGRAVRVVDVAAGHGRYVLDGIRNSGVTPDDVLLRDFDPDNVDLGRRLITAAGLRARFEAGDAFDRAALAALKPKPTIGIVSGFFELFPENDRVRETLSGLSGAMETGGYLIYTGQPWHPQIELIARTLASHRQGAPWIMRRRTQEELDELVRTAGFRKLEQLIDPQGMFTVSLAEKAV